MHEAVKFRGRQVRVTTDFGTTHEGLVLAVGHALHGTSTDWLAIKQTGLDRFLSLATIDTIEDTPG